MLKCQIGGRVPRRTLRSDRPCYPNILTLPFDTKTSAAQKSFRFTTLNCFLNFSKHLKIKPPHQGSFVQFFGSNPSTALIDEYSNELHVAANNPRAYVAYSLDDSTVLPVYNGMLYSSRLRETGVSVKEKSYSEGGHSWTLWSDYPKVMIDWLNGL